MVVNWCFLDTLSGFEYEFIVYPSYDSVFGYTPLIG